MKITIEGVPGADGTYELDFDAFNNADWRFIKRETGVRFGEVDEALAAGDNDLLVAFALVALDKAGKQIPPAALWESTPGKILMVEDEVVDEGPPAPAPVSSESENGHTASGSTSSSLDGAVSPETPTPLPSGSPG